MTSGSTSARSRLTLFAAIVIGAVTTCAVAKSGQNIWLQFVALVPLFWAIRSTRVGLASACGALWGITVVLCGGIGVGPALPDSSALTCLLIAAPSAYAALGAMLTRWIGFSPLVLAVAWTGLELLQSPLGHRPGLTSSAYEQSVLLEAIARALGWVLVAFAVAFLNAALLSFVTVACRCVGNPYRARLGSPPLRIIANPSFEAVHSFLSQATRSRAPPRDPNITFAVNA